MKIEGIVTAMISEYPFKFLKHIAYQLLRLYALNDATAFGIMKLHIQAYGTCVINK